LKKNKKFKRLLMYPCEEDNPTWLPCYYVFLPTNTQSRPGKASYPPTVTASFYPNHFEGIIINKDKLCEYNVHTVRCVGRKR
jgi:hypothetical protein